MANKTIVFSSAVKVSCKQNYHPRRYVCILLWLTTGFEWGVKCKNKTQVTNQKHSLQLPMTWWGLVRQIIIILTTHILKFLSLWYLDMERVALLVMALSFQTRLLSQSTTTLLPCWWIWDIQGIRQVLKWGNWESQRILAVGIHCLVLPRRETELDLTRRNGWLGRSTALNQAL